MPTRMKAIVVEAFWHLTAVWVFTRLFPHRRIASQYGDLGIESAQNVDGKQEQDLARSVGQAVQIAARNVPWHSTCLMNAAAVKRMLDWRAIEATLYIGFKHADEEKTLQRGIPFEGHAWVRYGDQCLIGGPVAPAFKIVSFYGRKNNEPMNQ